MRLNCIHAAIYSRVLQNQKYHNLKKKSRISTCLNNYRTHTYKCFEGLDLFRMMSTREVNKNNLLGEQFLVILPKKSRKIIKWVGSLQFLSAVTRIMCIIFSSVTLRYVAIPMLSSANTQQFKGVLLRGYNWMPLTHSP